MALPLTYSIGNLRRRKLRTMLVILTVTLSIMVSLLMLALSQGMLNSLKGSAVPDNVIILSGGAPTLEMSAIENSSTELILKELPKVKVKNSVKLISPEIHLGVFIKGDFSERGKMGVVRGVKPIAWNVHPQWRLLEGDYPKGDGVCVGKLAETKLSLPKGTLNIGKTINFEGKTWEIVGIFEAPGTTLESEILIDFKALEQATGRDEVSCISAKLETPSDISEVSYFLGLRPDLGVMFQTEEEFYESIAGLYKPFAALTQIMAVVILLGGLFGCINTLYAAVTGRRRELATLRVLGYGKGSIFVSLVIESIAIAVVGGVIGGILSLFFSGMSVRMPMGAFRFYIGSDILMIGVAMSLIIGFVGAAAPGIKALKIPAVRALRE
jgi:ABC-type antimicrobial peptide transport system permease subunit